jgi:uncharacterized damage-inducible protein DinB
MHPLLRSHHATLRLGSRLFANCLDGVDDAAARRRPNEHTNNLAFLACHLVDARYFLARLAGAAAECPFREELERVRSIGEMRDYPRLDSIRTAWWEAGEIVGTRFAALSEPDLRRETEQEFPIEDRTLLGAIAFLLANEAYHIGQMGLVRKYLGLPPMSYEPGSPP